MLRNWADQVVKTISDATVGTVIVLVHATLADRKRKAVHVDGMAIPLDRGRPRG
jgi:hypothetical protein